MKTTRRSTQDQEPGTDNDCVPVEPSQGELQPGGMRSARSEERRRERVLVAV